MSTGWVYILSNPSIPHRVKVGWTKGRPETRARELQTTGVPTPFKVETALLFSNAAGAIEARAHQLLSDKRVSSAREFFECEVKYALEKIIEAAESLGEPVRDTDPVLVTEEELRLAQQIKEQERAEQEEREAEMRQQELEREALRQEQEKKLRPAREAYDFAKHQHLCLHRRNPGNTFPDFEEWHKEWNTPEARAERIRMQEAEKKASEKRRAIEEDYKQHLAKEQKISDSINVAGNSCMLALFLLILIIVVLCYLIFR